MSRVQLAVVIPHHGRRDLLERTLAAVVSRPVIVVDDSPDGACLSGVRVVRTEGSVGFARAVNLGLSLAQCDGATHAVVLNDDAVPEPGCIDAMLSDWGPDVGAVSPVLIDPQGREAAGFSVSWWGRVRELDGRDGGGLHPVAVSGACLLIDVRERFDPRFRHGFEDLELCRRIHASGRTVRVTRSARCGHVGGGTVSRRSRQAARHALSGHLLYWGGGWRTGVVVVLALLQVVRERGPVGRIWGICDGWRDFRRIRQAHRCGEPPSGAVTPSLPTNACAAAIASSSPGSSKIR